MKIENQRCSLEQAKRLKELGVEQISFCFWTEDSAGKYSIDTMENQFEKHIHDYEISVHPEGFDGSFREQACSAFTVAELGVMLPHEYYSYNSDTRTVWYCLKDGDESYYNKYEFTESTTEAQARAAMLIYLLENNLITAEEVNQRLLNG